MAIFPFGMPVIRHVCGVRLQDMTGGSRLFLTTAEWDIMGIVIVVSGQI